MVFTQEEVDGFAVRAAPHWKRVRRGQYLGIRKISDGATWIGRVRTKEGKQKYKALGDFYEVSPMQAMDSFLAFCDEFSPLKGSSKPSLTNNGIIPPWAAEAKKNLEEYSHVFSVEFAEALIPKLVLIRSVDDLYQAAREAFIATVEAQS